MVVDHRYWYCEALRKLGHKYNNPPNALVEKMLEPFCDRVLPKGEKARRKVLVDAAKKAIQSVEVEGKPSVQKGTERPQKRNADKAFYESWEWKRVRYEAIRINGRRCQCCGWQPGDTASGWLVVDHIRPRRKFPDLELEVSNLQVLCNDCNMGKGSQFSDDFRGLDSWLSSIGRE